MKDYKNGNALVKTKKKKKITSLAQTSRRILKLFQKGWRSCLADLQSGRGWGQR